MAVATMFVGLLLSFRSAKFGGLFCLALANMVILLIIISQLSRGAAISPIETLRLLVYTNLFSLLFFRNGFSFNLDLKTCVPSALSILLLVTALFIGVADWYTYWQIALRNRNCDSPC